MTFHAVVVSTLKLDFQFQSHGNNLELKLKRSFEKKIYNPIYPLFKARIFKYSLSQLKANEKLLKEK